jgi:hypothetical protein
MRAHADPFLAALLKPTQTECGRRRAHDPIRVVDRRPPRRVRLEGGLLLDEHTGEVVGSAPRSGGDRWQRGPAGRILSVR